MFDLEGFANKQFAVNCRTKKEMEDFLSFLHSEGFTWNDSTSLMKLWYMNDIMHREYGEDACFMSIPTRKVLFFDGECGDPNGIPIIPYRDCIFDVLPTDENVSLLLQLLGA